MFRRVFRAVFLWVAWQWMPNGTALAAVSAIHITEDFTLPNDNRTFTRHVLIPTEDESKASLDSSFWYAANAGEIWADASAKGFTQGVSGRYYASELTAYREGKWPAVFITEKGSWELVLHLCYSHRWDDSPLPWEDRFLGDDDGILPEKIEATPKLVFGSFVFPYVAEFPELQRDENQAQLMVMALLRPHIVGERTELKYLMGRQMDLVFLRELFHASSKYGIHRHSYRPVPEALWAEFDRFVGRQDPRQVAALIRPLKSPRKEELRTYLEDHFLSREWQRYIGNSTVYAHISGEQRGVRFTTSRRDFFERHLELPPSAFSFLESYSVGTPLVRTDIEAVPMPYFEDIVLRSLDRDPRLQKSAARYLDSRADGCPERILDQTN